MLNRQLLPRKAMNFQLIPLQFFQTMNSIHLHQIHYPNSSFSRCGRVVENEWQNHHQLLVLASLDHKIPDSNFRVLKGAATIDRSQHRE